MQLLRPDLWPKPKPVADDVPRFSEKETSYVLDVLHHRFDTTKNGRYNIRLEKVLVA